LLRDLDAQIARCKEWIDEDRIMLLVFERKLKMFERQKAEKEYVLVLSERVFQTLSKANSPFCILAH
jgi:hypothetical protein